MPYRVVLDTNVLVSSLLGSSGPPAHVVDLATGGRIVACYDARILAEYREVLSRPRFRITPDAIASTLRELAEEGLAVLPAADTRDLPDESDRPFLEVALTADAWLVTGNLRHFPGVPCAISPRAFLDLIEAHRRGHPG